MGNEYLDTAFAILDLAAELLPLPMAGKASRRGVLHVNERNITKRVLMKAAHGLKVGSEAFAGEDGIYAALKRL